MTGRGRRLGAVKLKSKKDKSRSTTRLQGGQPHPRAPPQRQEGKRNRDHRRDSASKRDRLDLREFEQGSPTSLLARRHHTPVKPCGEPAAKRTQLPRSALTTQARSSGATASPTWNAVPPAAERRLWALGVEHSAAASAAGWDCAGPAGTSLASVPQLGRTKVGRVGDGQLHRSIAVPRPTGRCRIRAGRGVGFAGCPAAGKQASCS